MTKRAVCLVLLLAFVLAPAAASPAAAADVVAGVAGDPVRIMIVGDSVTQGSAGDWTWRYRLWRHLRADGVPTDLVGPHDDLFDNLAGVFGSQAYLDPDFDRDHAARWGATLAFPDTPIRTLVESYRPQVVVEMLGVNDLIFLGNSPQQVVDSVHGFVTDAQSADPEVDLVLGRLTQTWFAGVPAFNALLTAQAPGWATATSRIVVANADTGFDRDVDTWDTSHPDARGEDRIAASVADALSTLGVGTAYPRPLATLPLGPRRAPTLDVVGGDGRALLSWTPPPGADGEFVWVRDRTAGTALKRLPTRLGGTSWEATGLVNGHEYALLLQPAKGTHAAAPDIRSGVVAVVPRPPSPGQPSVTVSAFGVASLSWSRVERASGYRLEMRSGAGAWRRVASTTTPSYRVTGLRPAATYSFRVFARRDGVASDWSPVTTATVPLPRPVTDVTAVSPSRDVAVVSGRGTGEATSYQVSVHRAASCADPAPTGFEVVRTGLAEPRARLTPTASYLWVRLRSVRMGVTSGLDATSTACLHVR